MVVKELKEIKDALESITQPIAGTTILEILSKKLDTSVPSSVLYDLMHAGIIKPEKTGIDISKYEFKLQDKGELKLEALEDGLRKYLMPESDKADLLVWSFPDGLGLDKITGVRHLYSSLCSSIARCSKQIVIVNPYFNQGGTEKIGPYLKAAIKRGVAVRIITGTADVQGAESKNSLTQFLSSMQGEEGSASIKTFYGKKGSRTFSTHAKCMIFDSDAAYIGSANLTQRSLSSNLEVGVLTFDKAKVAKLTEILEKVWELSKEVKL